MTAAPHAFSDRVLMTLNISGNMVGGFNADRFKPGDGMGKFVGKMAGLKEIAGAILINK